jgi:PAS domain S-box-containing protein
MKINQVELLELKKTALPQLFCGTEIYEKGSSEQFLLSMYDSVQTSIFIVDVLEDGDFRYFALNPTHERWLGIASEELRGKQPEDILSPVDAARVRQHYTDCVRFGKTISYEQCLQFQGVNTWWSTTLTPLKNAKSRIYRLIGTSINITPSKLLEQAELQKQQHISQLKQLHNFHSLVRRITQQIRDHVNIHQLLQSVVEELSQLLQLERCQIELYHQNHTLATVEYQYNIESSNEHKLNINIADFPEIYQSLLQKQIVQKLEVLPTNHLQLQIVSQLACPIFDSQGIFGNIWLIKFSEEKFNELEISLVQEIANECAIAIRQFQLHEKTKTQLKKLEKRERRKNKFLKTLAQEFRTPITNISLAAQTLESLLTPNGIIDPELVPQLLQILHNECGRENKLINDLLTLTYLKIEPEPPTLISIDLKTWLTPIVESFRDVTHLQQQNLNLHIQPEIPPLETDITEFERIISEILNHACQCTPPGESITVFANLVTKALELKISYSGVEIPHPELKQVFRPFYRFNTNSPWKTSNSGLELVLVKEMVKRLNGKISVQNVEQQITFTIKLPL